MKLTNLNSCAGIAVFAAGAALLAAGCSHPQPVVMAPPMGGQPMGGAPMSNAPSGVYNWSEVPVGQQVPINRAVFDQGGYQLFAQSGETIVVPFVNQNLYAMKFGMSPNGAMYFVNDGQAPTLYVPRGGSLENASAQGARWYPFSNGFNYTQPVYIGLAPSWSDFVGMGWYPGMTYYGGYWGYHPYGFSPMPGLYFNVFGHPYYGWNAYHNYYTVHYMNRYTPRVVYNNYHSSGRTFGSSYGSRPFGSGSTGSFGSSRSFGGSSGSFGSGRTFGGSSGSFGGSSRTFGGSSGSFGGSGRTFGGSSFGSGSHSFGGSSFGGSSHSFGGSSFGGSRSFSGSSFGSSRSFGGSSFGRSGSFGGGRRH